MTEHCRASCGECKKEQLELEDHPIVGADTHLTLKRQRRADTRLGGSHEAQGTTNGKGQQQADAQATNVASDSAGNHKLDDPASKINSDHLKSDLPQHQNLGQQAGDSNTGSSRGGGVQEASHQDNEPKQTQSGTTEPHINDGGGSEGMIGAKAAPDNPDAAEIQRLRKEKERREYTEMVKNQQQAKQDEAKQQQQQQASRVAEQSASADSHMEVKDLVLRCHKRPDWSLEQVRVCLDMAKQRKMYSPAVITSGAVPDLSGRAAVQGQSGDADTIAQAQEQRELQAVNGGTDGDVDIGSRSNGGTDQSASSAEAISNLAVFGRWQALLLWVGFLTCALTVLPRFVGGVKRRRLGKAL